jgi:hypothetical protein
MHEMTRAKLLQNMIFLMLIEWNWLEVFHEIRRMTPSLVSGHLEHMLSSQRQRIAAAIQDALDRPDGLTLDLSRLTGRMDSEVTVLPIC